MKPAIHLYQYVAPVILAPLSLALWWQEYADPAQVIVVWLIPILWAYIVPGIGTNVFKVWEFDVAWKLGRFRPHHGFVFGSAAAMLAWLIHGDMARSVSDVARYAFVLCAVLGFWNILYEIRALKAGILRVYNQPWATGGGAEAIAMDYSPWFFGGFGAAYGLAISGIELYVGALGQPGTVAMASFFLGGLALCIAVPVLGFIRHSVKTHGHSGTRPVKRASP